MLLLRVLLRKMRVLSNSIADPRSFPCSLVCSFVRQDLAQPCGQTSRGLLENMSHVAKVVVIRAHRKSTTLSPDGTAYFTERVITSAIPPNGWTTIRWGNYLLDGSVAVISWTHERVDNFVDDGALYGYPDRKAYTEEGEKKSYNVKERVDVSGASEEVDDEEKEQQQQPLAQSSETQRLLAAVEGSKMSSKRNNEDGKHCCCAACCVVQ